MIIFLGKQSWLALASQKANHHCEIIIIIAMIIGATNVITFNFSTDTFFMTLSSSFLDVLKYTRLIIKVNTFLEFNFNQTF